MWSEIHLGDLGTWIASVGTVAAVVYAYLQNLDTRKKEREREEKEQAGKVSAWLLNEGVNCWVALNNTSSAPVYHAILSLVAHQGAGPKDGKESQFKKFVSIIPPGQTYISIEGGGGGMHIRLGVEAGFTDTHGLSWVRAVDGKLEKKSQTAEQYYKVPSPIDWELPLAELPKGVKIDAVATPYVGTPNLSALQTLLGHKSK